MTEGQRKLLSYFGPLEPKRERKNFLDWLCSGMSVLIIIGSLILVLLWHVNVYGETIGGKPSTQSSISAPADQANPTKNK